MEKEFETILKAIEDHLKREKIFISDPERTREIVHAMEIAKSLFPDLETEIEDDPLQTGALILSIKCTDVDPSMIVYGEDIERFNEMVSKANNFEFCVIKGKLQFHAVFSGALKIVT